MADKPKDLYEILGVNKNATDDELKKAYNKLARKYHPDLHPDDKKGAEEKMKEINAAYAILKDPEKRARYDQFGFAAFQGGGAAVLTSTTFSAEQAAAVSVSTWATFLKHFSEVVAVVADKADSKAQRVAQICVMICRLLLKRRLSAQKKLSKFRVLKIATTAAAQARLKELHLKLVLIVTAQE